MLSNKIYNICKQMQRSAAGLYRWPIKCCNAQYVSSGGTRQVVISCVIS